MTDKKTEEKNEDRFQLVEVPTQVGVFIKDMTKDEVLDDKFVLVTILNKLEKLTNTLL